MGSMFGQSVNPSPVNPMVGTTNQANFFQALFNNAMHQKPDGSFTFSGIASYPGQVSPDINSSLKSAWSNWAPWNTGTSYAANWLSKFNPNTPDPTLAMLMNNGGTGGPGSKAMAQEAQFGAPAGPLGTAMGNLASGYATGPAAWLAPFLRAGTSAPYQPPAVNLQPVTGGI